jgi:hypothetical protein
MIQIEIDQEVFDFLQENAKPFVDTPNTVLRKLLGIGTKTQHQIADNKSDMSIPTEKSNVTGMNSNEFVQMVLDKEFEEEFRKKTPYRLMYESDSTLIYFQNFNQENATLWYRINEKPFRVLMASNKKCFICLTNPAESIAYVIPIDAIEKQMTLSNWERNYLEVNIDNISRKWKELDWNIKQFLKKY